MTVTGQSAMSVAHKEDEGRRPDGGQIVKVVNLHPKREDK
jgi:hypothetical protein